MTWPTKKLGEVCDINMGQSPSSLTYNKNQNGLPFYQGKKDYGEMYPTPRVWCSESTKIVEAGDILISVRAPVGVLNIAQEKSCIGRGLTGLHAGKNLDQNFLFHFLKLKEKDIANLGTGSTFTAISKKHLENLEIPFPPIAEQKKIVAKLEKLLARTKEAKRLRAEAQEATQNLLPAELHKIFEEGKKKGWEEHPLGSLSSKITDGTHYTPTYADSGIPFISVKNLTRDTLDFTDCKYISKKEHEELIKRCHPEFEDVLLTKVGTTGIARIVNTKKDFSIFVSVALIKPKREKINPHYLTWILNAPALRGRSENETEGVGNKNLVLRKIYKFPILLPSLAEQKKIVARLDAMQEKIRRLQEHQKSTQSDLVKLEQSILHEAFDPDKG